MKKWIVFLFTCLVLLGFWLLIVADRNTPATVQTFNSGDEVVATEATFTDTDLAQYADYYVPSAHELTEEEAIERGLITETQQEVIAVEDNEEPYEIVTPEIPGSDGDCVPNPEPILAPGFETTTPTPLNRGLIASIEAQSFHPRLTF